MSGKKKHNQHLQIQTQYFIGYIETITKIHFLFDPIEASVQFYQGNIIKYSIYLIVKIDFFLSNYSFKPICCDYKNPKCMGFLVKMCYIIHSKCFMSFSSYSIVMPMYRSECYAQDTENTIFYVETNTTRFCVIYFQIPCITRRI